MSVPVTETKLDFPKCRASRVCPICELPKEQGIIVCWPCYRLFNFRHGMTGQARVLVNAVEYLK